MSVVLECAQQGDASKIGAILSDWIDEVDWMPRVHPPSEYPGHGELLIAASKVSVARENGRVLGFLARQGADIQALYVTPCARGRGIGQALLNAAKAEAGQLGLWSFQANAQALRFYQRAGFVEDGRSNGQRNDEKLPDMHLIWERGQDG